jgi:hypothetical protein
MTIVWPCPLSVDAYVAQGKKIEVPRPDCADCSVPMTFWSGYRRIVRVAGHCRKLFVRRARCKGCRASHALLPSFLFVGRRDVTETIGEVIGAVVTGCSGVRPAAAAAEIAHETARGLVRRFRRRADELAVAFAALAIELGGEVVVGSGPRGALRAIGAAFSAASALPGWAGIGLWRFVSSVSGGRALSTNTISPYLVIGKRRFMPPVA